MEPFTQRVIEIIKEIPEGKVMTYGQIASQAGNHKGARQVARFLHTLSTRYELPWHRVINSKGEISIQDFESSNLQKLLLENEGVKFTKRNTISLNEFQYHKQITFKEFDLI
ncbi:MAG: MGMT family protein [Clostridium sp.]|uniref:MGMT family protein n=1 Tax=Clostridium sp. TaxID=1506 RepID=UPI003D6CE22E